MGWKVTDLRLDGAGVPGGPRQGQGPARERRTGAAQRRRLTSERQRTLADTLGELAHSELKKAKATGSPGKRSGPDVARRQGEAS